MMTHLACAIVHRYPAAWRERYEDEVLALMDDSSVRLADVVELLRGLFVERVKALIEPGDHPTLTDWGFRTVLWFVGVAPALTIVVGGAALGGQLGAWFGEPHSAVPWITVACCWAVVIVDVGGRRIFRIEPSRSINLALVLVTCLFVVMWHWSMAPSTPPSSRVPAQFHTLYYCAQLFLWLLVAHRLLGWRLPWRPMLDAVERFQAAREAVQRAQTEVDRYRASTDRAAPFHLQPALAALAHKEQERDQARAVVETYGYRARFRQSS